jgi:pimeloyl-ACP methyl ester carboxylesterase
MITFLKHHRIRLALHQLKSGAGGALLLLHGLGEQSSETLAPEEQIWQGPVYALDFTGHGRSTVAVGGGYTCEALLADADCALAKIGHATLLGRGLGAYIAFLLGGARPKDIDGVILCDGPGLAGGGTGASSPNIPIMDNTAPAIPDPFAMAELSTDIRLPEYVSSFARQIAQHSPRLDPVFRCAVSRPPWLASLPQSVNIVDCQIEHAIKVCNFYANAAYFRSN